MAIVWGIRICRPYLEQTRFRVHSDHQAHRWLFAVSMSESNPRLVRWKLALSTYDFEVIYKPGPQQRVADELSRMVTTEYATPLADDEEEVYIPCLTVEVSDDQLLSPPTFPRKGPIVEVAEALEAISIEEVREAQAKDTWCQDQVIGMECGSPLLKFADLLWDSDRILSYKSQVDCSFLHAGLPQLNFGKGSSPWDTTVTWPPTPAPIECTKLSLSKMVLALPVP